MSEPQFDLDAIYGWALQFPSGLLVPIRGRPGGRPLVAIDLGEAQNFIGFARQEGRRMRRPVQLLRYSPFETIRRLDP